ncbi:MAG: flagellar hook assembly protein FlgD [Desulfosarcina sp.]|nr:flagellar hook assembly protein FlgD [Desulfobacterales bacterium]
MSISGVEATMHAAAGDQTSKPGELGRDDFLNLLVTQLQHQDPLSPMDSADFTAQLAQFSSLEQLSNMSGQLKELVQSQTVFTNSQAVGYIGHTVLSGGNAFAHDGSAPATLSMDLKEPAQNVFMSVYDPTGAFVASFETGSMPAGRQTTMWNGQDHNGNPLPGGSYRFEAVAVDANGGEIEVHPLSRGRVDGVAFRNGAALLMLGDREVRMADVIEVVRPAGSGTEA